MRRFGLAALFIAAAAMVLAVTDDAIARGGGGRGGGGWSGGGRGGGGFSHAGGGGERNFDHGGHTFEHGGDGRNFEHPDHVRPDNGPNRIPDHRPDTFPDHNPDHNPNHNPDHHPNYPPHPPAPPPTNPTFTRNVNVTGNGDGWYRYGAADDALAGMMMVTALGAVSAQPASTNTVVIQEPPAQAVDVAPATPSAPAIPSIGDQVSTLPDGCQAQNINGTLYYQSGSAWYRPYFGGSGVYYQVVQPPADGGGAAGQG